jgi:hypothetical protein
MVAMGCSHAAGYRTGIDRDTLILHSELLSASQINQL